VTAHVLGVEVRSRGRATLGQISLLVHVETMLALCESADHAADGDGSVGDGLDDLQATRDVLHGIVRHQTNDRHLLLIESIRCNQYGYQRCVTMRRDLNERFSTSKKQE